MKIHKTLIFLQKSQLGNELSAQRGILDKKQENLLDAATTQSRSSYFDIFKAKDLKNLVSMFDGELKVGPPLSYFKNKTFDEAFQQDFQDMIINSKIYCNIASSNHGFTVGNTLIWFDKTKDNRWVIRRIHYVVE